MNTTPTTGEIRPNPIQTTGPTCVRFDYAEGGSISLQGEASISILLELGALLKTRHYDHKSITEVTATDSEGRKFIIESGGQVLDSIQGGIGVIGKLLVHSANELDPEDITEVGWLLNGLAAIAGKLRFDLAEISNEAEILDHTGKAP